MLAHLQRYPFIRLLIPLLVGILLGDYWIQPLLAWCLFLMLLGSGLLLIGSYRFRLTHLYGVVVMLFLFTVGYQSVSRQLVETHFTFPEEETVYKVRIQDKPEEKERSLLCRVRLLAVEQEDSLHYYATQPLFLLYFSKQTMEANLKRGDELLIQTRLSPPVNNGNPDEFDYARYLRRRGGSGTAYVPDGYWKVVGHDSTRTFRQKALDYRESVTGLYRRLGFRGDELAVLSALTVGDKDELDEEIIETYSVSGASHVLALSGLHIGFLYALCCFLLSWLWRRWHWMKPIGLSFVVLALWCFAFLTGLSSSVVRSVTMFSLLAVASLQSEKPLTLNSLAATAFLMLLFCPTWLFDVGFQLSFLAVAAILIIRPWLYGLWQIENRLLRSVWGLMTVSIAAQIGVAPLIVLYFSRFSTHFLLTNLWVIPMVSIVLYAAVFMLLLTPFPMLQYYFARVVEWLISLQNEVLRWIEALPYASFDNLWLDKWEVLLFYLFLASLGYLLWKRTFRSVVLVSCGGLLLLSYHQFAVTVSAPRPSIVFYNVRGCPSAHCLTYGKQSWLVCADSLSDTSRLQRTLSSHWNHLHIDTPQVITDDFESPLLSFQEEMLSYAGRRVYFLHDDRWRYRKSTIRLPIDYLYISKGYRGNIEELQSCFKIGEVIVDTSLSAFYRERIEDDCRRLFIPCRLLSEKGTIHVLL